MFSVLNNQMTISCLRPGFVENLVKEARTTGNFTSFILAKGAQYSRNGLYIGVALAAIGALGLAKKKSLITFTATTTLGVGLTCLSAGMLSTMTALMKRAI
jgi:hypothetical protein